MSLGQSTLSDAERITEAKKLLLELIDYTPQMQSFEVSFVTRMHDMAENNAAFYVSPKQLFWLRDLYGKYCI